MARFGFLGTSAAVPSARRDTTALVVATDGAALLVDCGGSPVGKLRCLDVDPLALTHVVITHLHPDHAYGLPSLVQNLILLGRRQPLTLVCRPEHAGAVRDLLTVFRLWERPGAFALRVQPVSLGAGARAAVTGELEIRTAPNDHGSMPNVAVRVDVRGGDSLVYSSDTRPCDAVADLARGAGILVHEATFLHRDRGRYGAHSSAREAGEVAARAGVARLILTHIDAAYHDTPGALLEEARAAFGGPVEVARELGVYPL